MGSISTVVTMGYGSFGSVNLLPTLGYATQAVTVPEVPGAEWSLGRGRSHWSIPSGRAHWEVPEE